MKNKRLINSWNHIQPDKLAKERMLITIKNQLKESSSGENVTYKKNQKKYMMWIFPLIGAGGIVLFVSVKLWSVANDENQFIQKLSKGNVIVTYIDEAPSVAVSSDLQWFTEDELFHRVNTSIFKGTVLEIQNIEIDFNGMPEYRALATIQIDKSYRGNEIVGDKVTVLLPCSINTAMKVSETGVISKLQKGMKGIFMPVVYNDSDYMEQHGAKVYWKSIAQYGMLDGERYAFLQTKNGLVFEKYAYKSISEAESLNEIEEYIYRMIK